MAYVKNIWVDQDVERPKTYEVTNNQDGSITLTDSFGLVTELGTPVNEVNMNHIEDGIAGCAIRKHNLTETFALGEWVLGGTGDDEGIYKSLIADNVGNAITDNTAWEKVEMGGGALRNIGETSNPSLMPSYYYVRSDGWCVQGGRLYVNGVAGRYTISFIKPFSNIRYSIRTTCDRADASYAPLAIPMYAQLTQSSMILACNQFVYSVYWEVKGYIEE